MEKSGECLSRGKQKMPSSNKCLRYKKDYHQMPVEKYVTAVPFCHRYVMSQKYRHGVWGKFTSPAVLWMSGVPPFLLGLKRVRGCWEGSCPHGQAG